MSPPPITGVLATTASAAEHKNLHPAVITATDHRFGLILFHVQKNPAEAGFIFLVLAWELNSRLRRRQTCDWHAEW